MDIFPLKSLANDLRRTVVLHRSPRSPPRQEKCSLPASCRCFLFLPARSSSASAVPIYTGAAEVVPPPPRPRSQSPGSGSPSSANPGARPDSGRTPRRCDWREKQISFKNTAQSLNVLLLFVDTARSLFITAPLRTLQRANMFQPWWLHLFLCAAYSNIIWKGFT